MASNADIAAIRSPKSDRQSGHSFRHFYKANDGRLQRCRAAACSATVGRKAYMRLETKPSATARAAKLTSGSPNKIARQARSMSSSKRTNPQTSKHFSQPQSPILTATIAPQNLRPNITIATLPPSSLIPMAKTPKLSSPPQCDCKAASFCPLGAI